MSQACCVRRDGSQVTLVGPAMEYVLDVADGVRPLAWRDRISGRSLEASDGTEARVWLDQADDRIWIGGWRGTTSMNGDVDVDSDPGLRDGYAELRFDDRSWMGMHSPAHAWYEHDRSIHWSRTHIVIPDRHRDQPLTLLLGGRGLFDHDRMRVFLNGHPIGLREVAGRWRDPGAFELGPGSDAYQHIRFGRDNVIALQLSGYVPRNAALQVADPSATRLMPMRTQWPAQFEQQIVVGQRDRPVVFQATDVVIASEGSSGHVIVALAGVDADLSAELHYRWTDHEAMIERELRVEAATAPAMLMQVDLLDLEAPGSDMSDGEQGFPVYVENGFYASVAHPAGWAIAESGRLSLKQYPGRRVQRGEGWRSMRSLIGAAGPADARSAFVAMIEARMRRAARRHDRPLSIGTAFGSWDYDPATAVGPYAEVISQEPDESILLSNLTHLKAARADGLELDWFVLDFWVDQGSDLEAPDRRRFPGGFEPVRRAAAEAGARFGLWLDSSMAAWTIGENPAVSGCLTHDPGYGTERASLCWAAEPYRSLATAGYLHLVADEGVGLLKFDNLQSICYRSDHDHLPGIWSTEAIMSSVLEALRAIDRHAADTILMLYWGHRSPWWLTDADTLFEPGFWIEAAHPASSPTLYVRDSVIQGLDQAQRFCRDVPAMGKDSLGVWLSDWKWNSSIGTERWQEALIMDMCRGSLMTQIWSDATWLTPPQRRELARFHHLLSSNAGAFASSRPIGGDPWRAVPYGYVCSDGERAFVALFNASWQDASVPLELGPAWGMAPAEAWRVVRHHPRPAELSSGRSIDPMSAFHLRPFEIVLLECLPADLEPTIPVTDFDLFPDAFSEPSELLDVSLEEVPAESPDVLPVDSAAPTVASGPTRPGSGVVSSKRTFRMRTRLPATSSEGMAVAWLQLARDGRPHALDDVGSYFAATATLERSGVPVEPVVRQRTYSTPWQAWRIAVGPSAGVRTLEMRVTAAIDPQVTTAPGGCLIPGP